MSAGWLVRFQTVLAAFEMCLEMTAPVMWIAKGGTFAIHHNLLEGSRILAMLAYHSDILGLHQSLVVSSLSCWMGQNGRTGEHLELLSAKAGNYTLVMNEIDSGLPELNVFARNMSCIIIWWSHIVFCLLLLAKPPTGWSHIEYLWWRSVRWHRMWTKSGDKQIINSIGGFKWSRVLLGIIKVAVIFCKMKASYIHLTCHELRYFTAPLIPCNPAEKKQSYAHTSCLSLLYARIHILASWIEAHLCLVHDCKVHSRDMTWYLQATNKNYIQLEG